MSNDPVARAKSQRELNRTLKELEEAKLELTKVLSEGDQKQAETEVAVKVLDSKISERQNILDKLNAQIVSKESENVHTLEGYKAELKDLSKLKDTLDTAIGTRKSMISDYELTLQSLKDDKERLDTDIAERKQYQIGQEKLIEATAQNGNEQLKSINWEIGGLEREREEVLTKLHENKELLNQTFNDIEVKQAELRHLSDRYEEVAEGYRTNLSEMRQENVRLKTERETGKKESEATLTKIKHERIELEVMRDVLDKQRIEVANEKRRVESQRQVYGIQ